MVRYAIQFNTWPGTSEAYIQLAAVEPIRINKLIQRSRSAFYKVLLSDRALKKS